MPTARHFRSVDQPTLQIQAGVSRMRRTVNAEEAAAKAGVKMVGPLFLLFACIMLLVMGPMILKLAQQSD